MKNNILLFLNLVKSIFFRSHEFFKRLAVWFRVCKIVRSKLSTREDIFIEIYNDPKTEFVDINEKSTLYLHITDKSKQLTIHRD